MLRVAFSVFPTNVSEQWKLWSDTLIEELKAAAEDFMYGTRNEQRSAGHCFCKHLGVSLNIIVAFATDPINANSVYFLHIGVF